MNDITALMATMKAAAEKATPGPWHLSNENKLIIRDEDGIWIASTGYFDNPIEISDGEFIAEANPINVLALVEALDKAQQRIAEYHAVLNSLAFVARRYLPDYDEHPEIQAADELLESAAGIQVIEGDA